MKTGNESENRIRRRSAASDGRQGERATRFVVGSALKPRQPRKSLPGGGELGGGPLSYLRAPLLVLCR